MIGNNITSIGNAAFNGCDALNNVIIGSGVTNIGTFAFGSSDSFFIPSFYFRGNAPSFGSYVFKNRSATVYYLPGTTGWGSTFDGFPTALWSTNDQYTYTTNNGSITITGYTAGSTNSGGALTIPDTLNGLPVASIGDYAFEYCGMTNVTIPDSVTSILDNAFYGCINLISVKIGNSVTGIWPYAFGLCINLTSVTIGNSVASIWSEAFFQCYSLTSVTIPSSVTIIANYAFEGCSLTGVYFQGNVPVASSGMFILGMFHHPPNPTVYYLPGTTGWDDFFAGTGTPTVLWNPQAQNDSSFGVQNNQFGFNITGSSNLVIVVEACNDLANPNWCPVGTNTLTGGLSYFSDPDWTNYPGRFYRLRSP